MRVIILTAMMAASFMCCLIAAVATILADSLEWLLFSSLGVFVYVVYYINRHSKELEAEIDELID